MTRGYEREVMRSVRPEAIERYNWPEVTIPRRWSTNRYDTMNWFSRKCEFPHIVDKIGLIESVELIAIRGNFNNLLIFNNFFFFQTFESYYCKRFDQMRINRFDIDYSKIVILICDCMNLDQVTIVWHWIIITYLYKRPRIKKRTLFDAILSNCFWVKSLRNRIWLTRIKLERFRVERIGWKFIFVRGIVSRLPTGPSSRDCSTTVGP